MFRAAQRFRKVHPFLNPSYKLYSSNVRVIDKILIANRGEIACRVIKTARRLGIKTVAVYSDADAKSMHVALADEAFHIGPPTATESYLRGDKIIEVAKKSGANAIHPGYGFLSENEHFARDVENNGLIFIGPPASAINKMGSKSESKEIMIDAKVPVVPGYHGENQDLSYFQEQAKKIGYPVLLKAVLGGGGKGMRVVESQDDLENALELCRKEALRSFKDERVLIEKYITRPRHIEIQVFADSHGNCVYLFERDCSVQRRHQKIIEEAPAPHISSEFRAMMGKTAVDAARAVGYRGAGTVEFIYDVDTKEFYFMEMNTRLQVEHPITEKITGQDLVEWQIRVAEGHKLPLSQEQLKINGHAFEARIYAEDPDGGFLPGTGKLHYLKTPQVDDIHVRVDTGVGQGDEVSIYYDPMIAKLVVWDTDRHLALRRLSNALEKYSIAGLQTNIEFLIRLSNHPEFQAGNVDTGFIPRYHADLIQKKEIVPNIVLALTELSIALKERNSQKSRKSEDPYSPWSLSDGYRLNHRETISQKFVAYEHNYETNITYNPDGSFDIEVVKDKNNEVFKNVTGKLEDGQLTASIGGEGMNAVFVETKSNKYELIMQGKHYNVDALIKNYSTEEKKGSILAPIAGRIEKIFVKEGDKVREGDPLYTLESMKIQNKMTSLTNGIVKSVLFKEGTSVDKGELVLIVESE